MSRSAICRGSTNSRALGLFDGRLPKRFGVPQPSDDAALREDEEPLEDDAPELLDMEFPDEPEAPEEPDEEALTKAE